MKNTDYYKESGYHTKTVHEVLECGRTRALDKDDVKTRKVFKLFVGGHGGDFACERQAIREILPEVCRLSRYFAVSLQVWLTLVD
jgi:hypothetical protein